MIRTSSLKQRKKIQAWRSIFFVEMLIMLLLFCLISGYVFWHTLPISQYCHAVEQCMDLPDLISKVKLAMSAGILFIYSFLGVLAVLFAIPFVVVYIVSRLKS